MKKLAKSIAGGILVAGALVAGAGPAFAQEAYASDESRQQIADGLSDAFIAKMKTDKMAVAPLPVLQAIAEIDSHYDASKVNGDRSGLYQLTPEDVMMYGTDGDGDKKVDALNPADAHATAVNKGVVLTQTLKKELGKEYPANDFQKSSAIFVNAWAGGTKEAVKNAKAGKVRENADIARVTKQLVDLKLYKVA